MERALVSAKLAGPVRDERLAPHDRGYLAGYFWLARFPLMGTIAGVVYLVSRQRAALRPAPETR